VQAKTEMVGHGMQTQERDVCSTEFWNQ
jgi:hypothetical protein